MISLDTETTGLDLFHGCQPFIVVTCDEDGSQKIWEWDVNPLTRITEIPDGDIFEIGELLQADEFILHNAKYDIHALASIGLWDHFDLESVWPHVRDTSIASHLVHSNYPKDLTSLSIRWLDQDLTPFEEALERCVTDVRHIVQQAKLRETRRGIDDPVAKWRIATEGDPMIPSAGKGKKGVKELWRNDYWLPRAYAKHAQLPEDHEYWHVTREYALRDPAATLAIWDCLKNEIQRRGLEKLFIERMKMPRITYDMERRGVTLSSDRLKSLQLTYKEEAEDLGNLCVGIAAEYGCDLKLPKGASPNGSFQKFVYDDLKMPKIVSKKAKTSAGSLDKDVIQEYLLTTPVGSNANLFFRSWQARKKRNTSLAFMDSYDAFARQCDVHEGMLILHPTFNISGTDTLRFSCVNPNAQQISKQEAECEKCEGEGCQRCKFTGKSFRSMKYAFGPAPRREWYSLDAKNIELRLPFYESGEKELINLFENPDEPPFFGSNHLLNFATVYPEIWKAEVWKQMEDRDHIKKKYTKGPTPYYSWCKNGGFAIQYQAGDATADAAFHRPGARALLKSRFGKLEQLNARCCQFANKHGYIETIVDKRMGVGYPLMLSRSGHGRIKPTLPLSYRIQGSAMWWTICAEIAVEGFFQRLNDGEEFAGQEWPGGYYIPLQVHDELVIDCPQGPDSDYNRPVVDEVKRLMAQGGDHYGIPTPVGCERHVENWAEGTAY